MGLSVERYHRGHTRWSFRVMSVRRVELSVTGDEREEAERRDAYGRNNALLERRDMMMEEVRCSRPSIASQVINKACGVCRRGSL